MQGDKLTLMWAQRADGAEYVIDVQDPTGNKQEYLQDQNKLDLFPQLAGRHQWRVAMQIKSQHGGVDRGPWGDTQAFNVVAQPVPPKAAIDTQSKIMHLRWSDQKASSYDIERSRDKEDFGNATKSVLYKSLRNEIGLANLDSGVHFIRYRAIEPDGFIGTWSDAMKIDIPTDWQHLLIYLGGGSKQWP
jgi:hypothetical protein